MTQPQPQPQPQPQRNQRARFKDHTGFVGTVDECTRDDIPDAIRYAWCELVLDGSGLRILARWHELEVVE